MVVIKKGSPEWELECDEVYDRIVNYHMSLREVAREMYMSHSAIYLRVQWIKETRGLEYLDMEHEFQMHKKESIEFISSMNHPRRGKKVVI